MEVLLELDMWSGLTEDFGIWTNDATREIKLFALALWEVSDAVNLVTSLTKVYFNKNSMESGKTIVMGCF